MCNGCSPLRLQRSPSWHFPVSTTLEARNLPRWSGYSKAPFSLSTYPIGSNRMSTEVLERPIPLPRRSTFPDPIVSPEAHFREICYNMAPRPRLGEHRNSSSASRSRQQTALQALPPDESSSEDDCKDVGVHLQSSRRSNTFIRRDSRLTDYGNDDYAPRFPYSFTPSRASTGLASATSTGSGGGVPETEGLPEMNGHANMVESVKHRLDPGHVFKSRYTGEGFLGGVHTADLTVTAHKRHEHRPLFRWM